MEAEAPAIIDVGQTRFPVAKDLIGLRTEPGLEVLIEIGRRWSACRRMLRRPADARNPATGHHRDAVGHRRRFQFDVGLHEIYRAAQIIHLTFPIRVYTIV